MIQIPGSTQLAITDALVRYVSGVPRAVDFRYRDGYPICVNSLTGDIYVIVGNTITQAVRNAAPAAVTGATYVVASTDSGVIANRAGTVTLTLPSAASFPGRTLRIRTIQAQTVVSGSSNVVPLAGGAAGTAILAATAGKWALLQSNGTAWEIMEAN